MLGAGNEAWDAWKLFSDDPFDAVAMMPPFCDDSNFDGGNVQAKFNYRSERLARIALVKGYSTQQPPTQDRECAEQRHWASPAGK